MIKTRRSRSQIGSRCSMRPDRRVRQSSGALCASCDPELARRLGETNFLSGRARAGCVETPLGLLELDTGLTPAGAIHDGAAVLVLVRAEQILLSDEPGAGRGAARVLSAEFYGHDAVVRLCPEWDDSSTLLVRTSEAAGLPEEGTTVTLSVRGKVIGWAAGHCEA